MIIWKIWWKLLLFWFKLHQRISTWLRQKIFDIYLCLPIQQTILWQKISLLHVNLIRQKKLQNGEIFQHMIIFSNDTSRIFSKTWIWTKFLWTKKRQCVWAFYTWVSPVFMIHKKPRQESVANGEKLHYLPLFFAYIQIIRIADADLYPYLSNEKVQYVFLDNPIKTWVLAAQKNKLKSALGRLRKLVKQILHRRIKKENY